MKDAFFTSNFPRMKSLIFNTKEGTKEKETVSYALVQGQMHACRKSTELPEMNVLT